MDQKLRNDWRVALTSGKYDQGEVALCQQGSGEAAEKRWCCLGVLLDIVDPEGWTKDENRMWPERMLHPMKRPDGEYLSDEALEKVGMTMNEQQALAQLNDDSVPFSVISKTIRHLFADEPVQPLLGEGNPGKDDIPHAPE